MWNDLADYARRYPSPHNTQPVRLRVVDDERAVLEFVTSRGLPVGDPQGRFTFATFGIFVEHLRIAAHARGHELEAAFTHGPLYRDGAAVQPVAQLRLRAHGAPIPDFDPALLLRRRTNRHPYDDRPVPPGVVAELAAEARRYGHRLEVTTDHRAVRWVKQVNLDALRRDLGRAAYRRELGRWFRYSEVEARERRDGLSPSALMLPGWLLRGIVRHHRLLTAPVLAQVTGQVYLRTMTGIRTVGWVQGDFAGPSDWIRAGELMLRLWLILTRHGIDWHPYGSVITDEDARRRMVEQFGLQEGDDGRDLVWLLVRIGTSDREPVVSERLEPQEVVA